MKIYRYGFELPFKDETKQNYWRIFLKERLYEKHLRSLNMREESGNAVKRFQETF